MTKYERDPEFKRAPITDDYEIRWSRNLGTGVSGPVRLCIHRSTGQEYALKILLDRSDRKKAEIEANLHWRCSGGEHIVRVVDVYRNELKQPGESSPKKRILLVMELMEGKELFEYISKRHHFTEHEASKYVLQIAKGVQFCHRLNIAHRDIKPENLLLLKPATDPKDVIIKLADFGFAKVDNGDLKTPQFTPYYVAPQVLEAQRRQKELQSSGFKHRSPYYYDKSCDIWSVGVIMYIMLCGYPPFYSEVPHQSLSNRMKQKIMSADFDFPENDWKSITDEAKDLIKKMLCVEPSERLSIEEVMQHPWIAQNASPNCDLNSPYLISDKDALKEVQGTHAEFLQNLRRDDSGFFLKPVGMANNPVLDARKKKQADSITVVASVQTGTNEALQSIKSLQDICQMPPPSVTASSYALKEGVKKALTLNEKNINLLKALEQETWDGNEFVGQVDHKRLADSLENVIQLFEHAPSLSNNN